MKNIKSFFEKKFEIDSGQYKNGYYQLSKKQKKLWIFSLFFAAAFSSFVIGLFSEEQYPLGLYTIASAAFFIFISFTIALPFFGYCFFIKHSQIVAYQIWTVSLIITILAVIFRIDLSKINMFF